MKPLLFGVVMAFFFVGCMLVGERVEDWLTDWFRRRSHERLNRAIAS